MHLVGAGNERCTYVVVILATRTHPVTLSEVVGLATCAMLPPRDERDRERVRVWERESTRVAKQWGVESGACASLYTGVVHAYAMAL